MTKAGGGDAFVERYNHERPQSRPGPSRAGRCGAGRVARVERWLGLLRSLFIPLAVEPTQRPCSGAPGPGPPARSGRRPKGATSGPGCRP